MSLYISNPTKQNVVFFYREPRGGLVAFLDIASGGQAEIGHGWTVEEKAKVIDQLHAIGSLEASESHGKLSKKFLGLLYRDNAVVTVSEIEAGHEAVVNTQEQRSVSEATKAVLGFDRAVNEGRRGSRAARITAVEVEEQLAPRAKRTGNEVAMSIQIDPDGRVDAALPI